VKDRQRVLLLWTISGSRPIEPALRVRDMMTFCILGVAGPLSSGKLLESRAVSGIINLLQDERILDGCFRFTERVEDRQSLAPEAKVPLCSDRSGTKAKFQGHRVTTTTRQRTTEQTVGIRVENEWPDLVILPS
jgi:hypothetical protein